MSDFHRASLEMAWLYLYQITNESTKTENCYSSLNRELRWLWNSVYIYIYSSSDRHTLADIAKMYKQNFRIGRIELPSYTWASVCMGTAFA